MEPSAIDEIVRQHVFIAGWMSGEVVADDGWQQFERSLGRSFVIVGPGGSEVGRDDLLEGFETARGVMPGVAIEIRNAVVLFESDEVVIVRYEEWQLHPTAGNQRIATAVFAPREATPLGWSWIALRETSF